MNMSFYCGAVGAQQQQQRMNVQANNIANLNTYGFKAKRPSFASLMYGTIQGIDEQLPRGTGAKVESAATDFAPGPTMGSAMQQSYAIIGDGFFALADIGTGEVSYTRDGSFSLSQTTRADEDGLLEEVFYLSDGQGRLVLGNNGIPLEVTDPTLDQPVGVFDFVNRDGMRNVGTNRFVPVEKNGQVRLGTGVPRRGVLENSNADMGTEFSKVIEAQRSYSYALRMVQTSDEVENTILGLRG